eukprot:gene39123-48317_t
MTTKLNDDQRIAFAESTKKKPCKPLRIKDELMDININNNSNRIKPQHKQDSNSYRRSNRIAVEDPVFDVIPEDDGSVDTPEQSKRVVANGEQQSLVLLPVTTPSPSSPKDGAVDTRAEVVVSGAADGEVNEALQQTEAPGAPQKRFTIEDLKGKISEKKISTTTLNADITMRYSLRTQMYTLFALLLCGCVATMLWTLARVNIS